MSRPAGDCQPLQAAEEEAEVQLPAGLLLRCAACRWRCVLSWPPACGGDHEGANPTSALGFSTFTGTGQTLEYWKLSPWSACSRNSSVAGGEHSRWRTAQQVAPRHGLGGGSSPQLWPMPGWDRSPGWRARPWRGGVAEAAAGCVSILLDISVPAIHPM